MTAPVENPEWRLMADTEPYRIGCRIDADAGRVGFWYVYDMRDDPMEILRRHPSREAAIAYADQMNEEHRRWFR
jgi:hypothetical protein